MTSSSTVHKYSTSWVNLQHITPYILSQDTQKLNLKHCCVETRTLTIWTILQLYWLCIITLKILKGFSTIYLLICNVIHYFSKYCINLQYSWYVSVLVMCECVCYCAYFINVNKLHVHVCVLERAKHRFFVKERSQQFNFFSREIFYLYRHHQTLLILYYVLYNYVLYII